MSNKDADFCASVGCVGVIIAATCLMQHLNAMYSHWVTYIMATIYLLSLWGFVLLALKKKGATLFLIIGSVLLFLDEILLLLTISFSLIVLLLLLYSIVITIYIFISSLPLKLKQHCLYKKNELNYWNDKL